MAIQYSPDSKLFQVNYQAPFGGLDSSAFASAINPQNFADMLGVYVEDNIIKPLTLGNLTIDPTSSGIVGNYMGFIPISNPSTSIAQYALGYIVTDSNLYTVNYNPFASDIIIIHLFSYAPAKAGTSFGFSYIVIDKIQQADPDIYWTTTGWNEIWTFDPVAGISLLTNYVGGGRLALLNNQLLNLGGTSLADGTVPNRISWSASGQYGQFQPYNSGLGTGSYAAGFNDLPSTSDIINGFLAIGTVGYVIRTQGITQMTPTGNAVDPFAFNHLWASELGVGSAFPNSISQYGGVGAFVSGAGLYTLGLNGIAEIGSEARTYIYKFLNSQGTVNSGILNFQLVARVIPYLQNSPEIFYVFCITVKNRLGTLVYQFLAVSVASGKTYNLGQYPIFGVPVNQLTMAFYYPQEITGATGARTSGLVNILVFTVDGANNPAFKVLLQVFNTTGSLTFRKEQMKFGYVPTVSKVGFIAALVDSTHNGTISVSVDGGLTFGAAFADLIIVAGAGNPGQGIFDNVYLDGVQSLERPQLVVKLTNVQIAEAWYQGTLAEYELI